jgi:hypothetical protein
MAAAINAIAAMGGGTKEKFMEMAKEAAEEYLNGDRTPFVPAWQSDQMPSSGGFRSERETISLWSRR